MSTVEELRELALKAKQQGGEGTTVPLMVSRAAYGHKIEDPDPKRVRLFVTHGPWGRVGMRQFGNWLVYFKAGEVLDALSTQGER